MFKSALEILAELVALALFTAMVMLVAAIWIGLDSGIIR